MRTTETGTPSLSLVQSFLSVQVRKVKLRVINEDLHAFQKVCTVGYFKIIIWPIYRMQE